MKKNVFKLFGFVFLTLFAVLDASAQSRPAYRQSAQSQPAYDTVDRAPLTPAQKLELKIQRLSDVAHRLDMTDDQTDSFVSSNLEFDELIKDIRINVEGKEERKSQIRDLTEKHNATLASFLAEKNYSKVAKKVKGRKGKK